ncbi:Transcriptional regulator, predicted component of viral defense system [Singulisphaera sp. GP187]|uniref:type IV toxin-antitoxin system AbiEi family antitoxin domain-containing protein n=1 Tax=Singulisphaera sp. GP187 TaxID=1882752 RepID=UPI00092B99C4|nr:type IV toxin-antitoxin system AbiEi family antitoxin domain-containing protein [Singulisphaera sp. GP187]SIN78509.1 Transcriptional regulator, predicted component of viral defense system [Singulisphaera sp. GP187]
MARSSRAVSRVLFSKAVEQGGYFTAKQAKEVGYGYPHLDYHLRVGNFERVDHGLYRLPTVPIGEHDELVRLTLWSRNQGDEPQAVVSHESALVFHELSELLPSTIHLTVPPKFRKKAPPCCVLHRATLQPTDVEEHQGFWTTTSLRTLLDVAESDTSQEQLAKAVADALARGLVRKKSLKLVMMTQGAATGRLRAAVEDRATTSS